MCAGVAIAKVFAEAGLPEGLLQVLPGGLDAGEAVVAAPEVSVISFTGSTAAGRKVGEVAGRLLKRCHLELPLSRHLFARQSSPSKRGERR